MSFLAIKALKKQIFYLISFLPNSRSLKISLFLGRKFILKHFGYWLVKRHTCRYLSLFSLYGNSLSSSIIRIIGHYFYSSEMKPVYIRSLPVMCFLLLVINLRLLSIFIHFHMIPFILKIKQS